MMLYNYFNRFKCYECFKCNINKPGMKVNVLISNKKKMIN